MQEQIAAKKAELQANFLKGQQLLQQQMAAVQQTRARLTAIQGALKVIDELLLGATAPDAATGAPDGTLPETEVEPVPIGKGRANNQRN